VRARPFWSSEPLVRRYGRASLIVKSNKCLVDRGAVFNGQILQTAILDRWSIMLLAFDIKCDNGCRQKKPGANRASPATLRRLGAEA
jgi:hypothetical protein